jgi:hypothetical protein
MTSSLHGGKVEKIGCCITSGPALMERLQKRGRVTAMTGRIVGRAT